MKNIDNDEFSVQIPNNDRVKAFSAAIHLLHKVGKDMTIGNLYPNIFTFSPTKIVNCSRD